jgi:hypothetical protein
MHAVCGGLLLAELWRDELHQLRGGHVRSFDIFLGVLGLRCGNIRIKYRVNQLFELRCCGNLRHRQQLRVVRRGDLHGVVGASVLHSVCGRPVRGRHGFIKLRVVRGRPVFGKRGLLQLHGLRCGCVHGVIGAFSVHAMRVG